MLTAQVLRFDERLAAAGSPRVAVLLSLRPEVLSAPRPRDLRDLAARLDDPYAVATVLRTATLSCLQVAEALQALGGFVTRRELIDFLGAGAEGGPEQAVDSDLTWLTDRAVVRVVEHDLLEGSPGLRECFPDPLGLGPPLRTLLADQTVDALKRILRELGQPLPKSKAQALEALTGYLRDPDRVRAVAAGAPPAIGDWLARRALDRGATSPSYGASYNRGAYQLEQEAVRWSMDRGLLVGESWGYVRHMPAEVARALRGPAYSAPFAPHAPPVATHQVSADDVARESAAAATAFFAYATGILDRVSRTAVPALKSGGVGAREMTRLAKATGSREVDVRLVLELAARYGLLEQTADGVVVGDDFVAWRAGEPTDRYSDLVITWWRLGAVPTEARESGKALPALRRPADCGGCSGAREALLTTLSTLPQGRATAVSDVGPAAMWTRPFVHAEIEQDDVPFATTWAEAEMLGVVSRGALSPLGRLLLAGDRGALGALAADMLPGTTDQAVFGADMTAVVAGTPSARVTALLDTCADRESRGGAVVWRLTPGSVRRAFDDGIPGEQLEQELAEVARSGLPQPLRYLIGDVARRHGAVRVRPAVSCLRSDDAALLAQVAADRALKRLGLTMLAPTVLASQRPADETVVALRAAGYLPMPEDADGTVTIAARRKAPAPPAPRKPESLAPSAETVNVQALAATLVQAGLGGTGS